MWIETKSLPDSVRDVLARVSYGRRDVEVRVAETLVMSGVGSKGRRAFVAMVDLATGRSDVTYGSWGGPNPFVPDNAVDRDHGAYRLPDTAVIVLGSQGYPQTFLTLHVSPVLVPKMLPAAGEVPPTREELDALYAHGCIKGGAYRREELRRRGVRPETVADLVARGLLSENRAGARMITTAGRNALGEYRGH